MNLVVLGANGRTGAHVLQQALDKGVNVTAVVRSQAKCPKIRHERLKVAIGDPCDPKFLTKVFNDQQVVISTLGGRLPTKKATSVYPLSAEAIVEAALATGLKRVIVTSTALLFPPHRLVERLFVKLVRQVVINATKMEDILLDSDLDTTIARCGFLTKGEDDGYRIESGALPEKGSSVPRRSLASFLVDSASRESPGHRVYGVGPLLNPPS